MELCPHTGEKLVLADLPSDQYLISPHTGVIYYKNAKSLKYSDAYFTSEYKKQYGKTYIEDEVNLRKLAKNRLKNIMKFIRPPATLLEIGCAAGFFLDEAKKSGYTVFGLETSSYAAEYAVNKLGLRVIQHSFTDNPLPVIKENFGDTFDITAAFYTVEHFPDQKTAFQNISDLTRSKGIFACSLPSTYGPLFNNNSAKWVQTHPEDHFADYSPSSIRKILPLYGFSLYHSSPASFHPGRLHRYFNLPAMSFLYRFFARIFSYGDTMEIIAKKS